MFLLLAMIVDADVLGDTVEPGIEGRITSEVVDTQICLEVGLLAEVFDVLWVGDMPLDEQIDVEMVSVNEVVKSVGVALLCAMDEVFVRHVGCGS